MTAHRLGLVGSGIDMSLAPAFHVLAGKLVGIEVSYELIPVTPPSPPSSTPSCASWPARATTASTSRCRSRRPPPAPPPHRPPRSSATGVANTLLLGPDGPTHAHNTDMSGFTWAYRRRFGHEPPGTVAVLGAGGVGSATAAALVDLGATALRIYDVVPDRSHALAALLRQRDHGVQVDVASSAEGGGRRRGRPGQRHARGHVLEPRHAARPAGGRRRSGGSSTRSTRPSRPRSWSEPARSGWTASPASTCSSVRPSTPSRSSPGTTSSRGSLHELETNIGILERERGV